jgi:peptidoglycan/xylan/chitin deacetylase (PgdA/CDA1 family)
MRNRIERYITARLTRSWKVKTIESRANSPIATITFDDFPKSAWTTGGRILEEAGVRGTYFVAGTYCGKEIDGLRYYDVDDLIAAHGQGHEIGCHTFDHAEISQLSRQAIDDTLARNREFVSRHLGGVLMTSFAFPYGAASIRTKRILSKQFASCRGIWPPSNNRRIDLSELRAVGLEPHVLAANPIDDLIESAAANKGWLIFFTHDVSSSPGRWGCTPRLLEEIIAKLLEAKIEILPMKSALDRVAFSQERTLIESRHCKAQ